MNNTKNRLNICQKRVIIRVLLLSQLLALLLSLAPGAWGQDFWLGWLLVSFCLLWVSLVSLLLLCVCTKIFLMVRPRILLMLGVFILLAVTSLFSYLAYPLLSAWGGLHDLSQHAFTLNSLAFVSVLAVLGSLYINLYLDGIERVQAQASAELMALHAQIRPHFLFNCLNTVAELIHDSPKEAEQATLNLASLFRAALDADGMSSLAAEIELSKKYVELESWRFGQRLQVNWALPLELPHLSMPVLMLQPLIENAIRHGIEPLPQGGVVNVTITLGRQWLTIIISNPVTASIDSEGAGVALTNIDRRLKLWFSEQAQMSSGVYQGVYRVKLTLPLEAS